MIDDRDAPWRRVPEPCPAGVVVLVDGGPMAVTSHPRHPTTRCDEWRRGENADAYPNERWVCVSATASDGSLHRLGGQTQWTTASAVYQWVRAERLLVLSPAEAAWVRLGGKL